MAYPDRPGSDQDRERDWIRDERRRARGAYEDDGRDDVRRSYDYQEAQRDYDRDRRYAAPRQRERDYGSRGYIPYGTTGPTNYGGGYSGEIDHRPGDVGRAYAGGSDYEGYGAHEIPRGHYLGDTDGRGRDYTPNPREGRGEEARTWWDRTTDEVAAMLGDEDAKRRRQWDGVRAQSRPDHHGQHRGRGPQGYRRSDERIREDVSDRLTDDAWLDASYIEVQVADGEVTLSGLVQSRGDKRRAEDIADSCSGVGHVQNNLRVRPAENDPAYDRNTLETGGTAATQATTTTSGRA
jgi:osmotically-inducible protein OsmY